MAFLLEKLLPPTGNAQKSMDWYTESENTHVNWDKKGLISTQQGFNRTGYSFLVANGKEYYTLRDRKIFLPWKIVFVGTKFGVNYVRMSPHPEAWGTAGSGMDIDFKNAMAKNTLISIQHVATRKDLGTYEEYYIVKCKDRDPTLLLYYRTVGSGGATDNITLYYTITPTKKDLQKAIPKISSIEERHAHTIIH